MKFPTTKIAVAALCALLAFFSASAVSAANSAPSVSASAAQYDATAAPKGTFSERFGKDFAVEGSRWAYSQGYDADDKSAPFAVTPATWYAHAI